MSTTGQYWTTHTITKLIDVEESDEIICKMVFGTANASNYVEGTQVGATYLSVKAVEYDLT
jgi:hypothetical protein